MKENSRATLSREAFESMLLISITGLTLAGYLGGALSFLGMLR